MNQPLTLSCLLPLLIILLTTDYTGAETTTRLESSVDTLERQLEMSRHQQLTVLKKQPENMPAPFTTDGCSGGLSIGWEYLAGKIQSFQKTHGTLPPWESCCITHDKAYHTAGDRASTAQQSFEARKNADQKLKACVLETGVQRIPELSLEYKISPREVELLYTTIAELMYRSVRIGGMPCTGLPWRWGYGWPECN